MLHFGIVDCREKCSRSTEPYKMSQKPELRSGNGCGSTTLWGVVLPPFGLSR